ncbi:MAG: TlpA family protein disulfide reductase [Marivivens sp.]|nr:TlpA family protein disulfide reductase [Marivivens sp.]
MRQFRSALLYTALALVANTGWADPYGITDLRDGDMRKLAVHSAALSVSDMTYTGADGAPRTLDDEGDTVLLVNFWATWCAPCRKEMPSLAALQEGFAPEDFRVITIATGRNPLPAMELFFEEIGVDTLPLHRDERQGFARSMGVLGLPVSILIDRNGDEIARLQGDADWNSESARAIIAALVSG